MRAALLLARRDGALHKAIFFLDNEAVVKQCATLMRWSALRLLKCSDRDLWRCLAHEMKALAGPGVLTAVRWIRSHPEGRLAHAAWSRDDVANRLADRWAGKAHSLPCADGGYIILGAWDLAHRGTIITGPLRRSLKGSVPGAFWGRAGAGISAPFPVSAQIHRDFGGHGGIPWELKFRPCAQGIDKN